MPSLHTVAVRLATFLVPISILLSAYLYLYPFAHGCGFPAPPAESQKWLESCSFEDDEILKEYYKSHDVAPFRLLALGDPQLEGDTSLPSEVDWRFPGFSYLKQDILDRRWDHALGSLKDAWEDSLAEVIRILKYARKEMDLLGNDFYLAHIYRTLHWATQPTHVTVLGDLLGSQWIDDEEFSNRADRFWTRVFKGAEVVPKALLQDYANETNKARVIQTLGQDSAWKRRIINVAGNHDIGYAGDIVRERIERFERAFGPVNGDLRFTLPIHACSEQIAHHEIPTLRLVVLNSMNLDGPVNDNDLQSESYNFINAVIGESEEVGRHGTATILLTHIPLHKEAGICVDEPYFTFFPEDDGGGVSEQNMLSKDISLGATLQGLFGKSPDVNAAAAGVGRDGIILTGHDHEGCDVYHYVDHEKQEWTASKYTNDASISARHNASVPGLREVTARSMMGEFGGNAALVSAWWDAKQEKWQIEVQMCKLGVQHIWWAIHIIDLSAVAISVIALVTAMLERKEPSARKAVGTQSIHGRARTPRNEKAQPSPKQHSSTSPPKKKKSSAFSRRMQQSLEEGYVSRDSDSDTRRTGTPSSSKRSKKKSSVKLKSDA